jgi:SAM-dependent methyltransferase
MDMSPLAVLIASVKTTPVPGRLLEEFVKGIVTKLNTKQLAPELPLFDGSELDESPYDSGVSADPRLADSWYSKWFQPHVLRELLLVDGIVSGVGDVRLQRIAKVALSNVLRRSSNAHSGYPNVMFDRRAPKKPLPIRGFLRELEKVAEQVRSLETMADELRAVRVLQGDAGRAPIASGTVDAVVSHPPYIGSIPYAEYGALSLRWLGADPKALDNRLTGGKRQSRDVVARFSVGYSSMLQECARVLKPGGFAFLMVGNPVVRGELVDLAEMTRVLAGQSGFDLVVETTREGVNRRANKMGAEHLLFFERRAEI